MNNKIVIIGGGVAGLSAGIYGQKNGYDTEVATGGTIGQTGNSTGLQGRQEILRPLKYIPLRGA